MRTNFRAVFGAVALALLAVGGPARADDRGEGVLQSYDESIKWTRLSAEQGNSQTQYNLGAMYETGRGDARDMVEAHKWFNLAAANSGIGWDRADAYVSRDRVAGLLTPAQLAEAQKRAQDWKPRSAQTQAQVQ